MLLDLQGVLSTPFLLVCHVSQNRRDAGRSKEEIERLIVNEDLGDLERACLFLAPNAHPVSKQFEIEM